MDWKSLAEQLAQSFTYFITERDIYTDAKLKFGCHTFAVDDAEQQWVSDAKSVQHDNDVWHNVAVRNGVADGDGRSDANCYTEPITFIVAALYG